MGRPRVLLPRVRMRKLPDLRRAGRCSKEERSGSDAALPDSSITALERAGEQCCHRRHEHWTTQIKRAIQALREISYTSGLSEGHMPCHIGFLRVSQRLRSKRTSASLRHSFTQGKATTSTITKRKLPSQQWH